MFTETHSSYILLGLFAHSASVGKTEHLKDTLIVIITPSGMLYLHWPWLCCQASSSSVECWQCLSAQLLSQLSPQLVVWGVQSAGRETVEQTTHNYAGCQFVYTTRRICLRRVTYVQLTLIPKRVG